MYTGRPPPFLRPRQRPLSLPRLPRPFPTRYPLRSVSSSLSSFGNCLARLLPTKAFILFLLGSGEVSFLKAVLFRSSQSASPVHDPSSFLSQLKRASAKSPRALTALDILPNTAKFSRPTRHRQAIRCACVKRRREESDPSLWGCGFFARVRG